MDSKPGPSPGRRQEIDARLDAVHARLKELRERHRYAVRDPAASASERLEAAQRHATEAHVAALLVLASSAEAFRKAAEAHERVASVHDKAAAGGIGDVREHQQQAELHRAAATADWQRAKRAQSLLSEAEQAAPPVSGEPRDGAAPCGVAAPEAG